MAPVVIQHPSAGRIFINDPGMAWAFLNRIANGPVKFHMPDVESECPATMADDDDVINSETTPEGAMLQPACQVFNVATPVASEAAEHDAVEVAFEAADDGADEGAVLRGLEPDHLRTSAGLSPWSAGVNLRGREPTTTRRPDEVPGQQACDCKARASRVSRQRRRGFYRN